MGNKITNGYGSIPHLSTSKLTQQADKKIEMGQELILTKKARDWKDLIIVTEKIDGSNVAITRIDNQIRTVSRSGYDSNTSPYEQHHMFDKWVMKNQTKFTWIPEGYRLCGEWCVMAHGTIYDITNESPFVVFDLVDKNKKRCLYLDLLKLSIKFDFALVPLLHIGQPISIKNGIKLLDNGHYGNPDKPEGFVYRVEREKEVDFLAKWVRQDKEDGKYMKDNIFNKGYK